ncbi:hypothetical protein [Natronospira bacteriovora]|uniref:Uncharacterized protein n=1 Tax=Natronospira bacteriovora TaxID=3069753 RepID=A0ABU0W8H4_9GAMM|nr:hypothetical protein [Natronospira sp. AB-CW4]MDQ2069300.1 hypothetical protein [Natronospira sp. AB-CW4]
MSDVKPSDHPVDVMERHAGELGYELDPDIMSQLRAYCDEPVDAEGGGRDEPISF